MNQFIWNDRKGPLHIGVFGLHPNAGTTTISILIAAYFKYICGMETIVIEQSQKHDLCCLSEHSLNSQEAFFVHHQIFFDVSQEMEEDRWRTRTVYQGYVHDLGCNYIRSMEHEKEYQVILCVYHLTPWIYSIEQLKDKKEKLKVQRKKVRFLGNMLTREEQKKVGKVIKSYDFIEYEPDLFSPSVKTIEVFHHMIFS